MLSPSGGGMRIVHAIACRLREVVDIQVLNCKIQVVEAVQRLETASFSACKFL